MYKGPIIPTDRVRSGVTREEHRNVFGIERDYALTNCFAADIPINARIAKVYRNKFGGVENLKRQNRKVSVFLGTFPECLSPDHQTRIYHGTNLSRPYRVPLVIPKDNISVRISAKILCAEYAVE